MTISLLAPDAVQAQRCCSAVKENFQPPPGSGAEVAVLRVFKVKHALLSAQLQQTAATVQNGQIKGQSSRTRGHTASFGPSSPQLKYVPPTHPPRPLLLRAACGARGLLRLRYRQPTLLRGRALGYALAVPPSVVPLTLTLTRTNRYGPNPSRCKQVLLRHLWRATLRPDGRARSQVALCRQAHLLFQQAEPGSPQGGQGRRLRSLQVLRRRRVHGGGGRLVPSARLPHAHHRRRDHGGGGRRERAPSLRRPLLVQGGYTRLPPPLITHLLTYSLTRIHNITINTTKYNDHNNQRTRSTYF